MAITHMGIAVRTLTGHKSNIRSLDFHPYGEFIASGSMDTNLKVWDVRRRGCIQTYKGHTGPVECIAFSPDGRWVVSGAEDVKVSSCHCHCRVAFLCTSF